MFLSEEERNIVTNELTNYVKERGVSDIIMNYFDHMCLNENHNVVIDELKTEYVITEDIYNTYTIYETGLYAKHWKNALFKGKRISYSWVKFLKLAEPSVWGINGSNAEVLNVHTNGEQFSRIICRKGREDIVPYSYINETVAEFFETNGYIHGVVHIIHRRRKSKEEARQEELVNLVKNENVAGLKRICKEKGIRGYSKMKKDELITLLANHF